MQKLITALAGVIFPTFIITATLQAAPANNDKNIYSVIQSVRPATSTTTTSTTANSNLLKSAQTMIRLPKFVLPTLAFTCLSNPADAPERIVATLCRSVMRCVGIPGGRMVPPEFQEELANTCIRELSEGEAIQLWNDFGHEPENTFTTSQMRNEIVAGRAAVNTTAFCNCMGTISSLSCDTIERSLNNHTDYANFENLVPETPDCASALSR